MLEGLKMHIKINGIMKSFKEEVIYNHRFFPQHELLNIISENAIANTFILKCHEVVYRARQYKNDNPHSNPDLAHMMHGEKPKEETMSFLKNNYSFLGYDESGSFVPPKSAPATDGRANPQYIRYLYAALDPYTAMVEVRPTIKSYVSIAGIALQHDLKLMDFTPSKKIGSDYNGILRHYLSDEFSEPYNGELKGYIHTQCISEYIQSLGFDGVMYGSSLNNGGVNIAIFNYEKCKAIGSAVFCVLEIRFLAYSEKENLTLSI